MPEDSINLAHERERIAEAFGGHKGPVVTHSYVALPIAAALVFHTAHGSTRAIVTRADYDDALNMAAAALSRLVSLYRVADPALERAVVAVDLVHQRFARGATELRSDDGGALGDLSVRRQDLVSVLSLVRRAGLPFRLVLPALDGEDGEDGEA